MNIRKTAALFLLLALLAGCTPQAGRTGAETSPTINTEPLVTLTPAPPSPTPTDSGSSPLPTLNPDREANLYVFGVFAPKSAYESADDGVILLPFQETAAQLGYEFVWSSSLNTVALLSDGKESVKLTPGGDGVYSLEIDGENVGQNVVLQMKGGVIYAPDFLIELIADAEVSKNAAGDIFVSKRPEPTLSPPPAGDLGDGE